MKPKINTPYMGLHYKKNSKGPKGLLAVAGLASGWPENVYWSSLPIKSSRLQHLNFSTNSLQGVIPTNLSNYLSSIDLSYNDLVGKIPASFSSLSKLTYLDLFTNNLIGGIPPSLGNLSLLRTVDLGVNSITGTIPHSIGLLPNLRVFSIGMNKLSEYGVGGKISTQGDVYSYGILLLEMLTGKRPTDEMFTDGQSLHKLCKLALPEQVMGIADSRMLFEEPKEARNDVDQNEKIRQAKVRECLISLMRIGVACSVESPGERMNVRDAVIGLTTIKEVFLGVVLACHQGSNILLVLNSNLPLLRMLKSMRMILSSLLIHKIKLLSLVLFLTTATEVASAFSNKTDRLALLSFKELIAEDPLGSLSSWNNSLELCEWDGVTCSRKHQRVVVLDLRGKLLSKPLFPQIPLPPEQHIPRENPHGARPLVQAATSESQFQFSPRGNSNQFVKLPYYH
ncbi:hypothetical protein RHGRI_027625 [Rhododendron griersonianum]|uniref:Leucine-rich repeat-containing N-terminal plant-type domain-containing protein n=1 Tax=Rhododendron griersonianum TaxID=479676 RepID=A0AAV6IXA8_9ERIC|nr:hypothetical protein RHGRI_027625 [Rhododendron griersonianum]